MKSTPIRRKATIDTSHCVACGSCLNVCSRSALTVPHGIAAVLNEERCVGCGLCARECPASVITIKEVSA